MHWDRFFSDLEDQLSSEWEAEHAALEAETGRLRVARTTLGERLRGLCAQTGTGGSPILELAGGTVVAGDVGATGADWVALDVARPRGAQLIVPLASITGIRMRRAAPPRSTQQVPERPALSERMTFGFMMRDLARRRRGVVLQLVDGRTLSGTIDRAGADHLDLAEHDHGAARSAAEVTAWRIIAFGAIASVRVGV